MKKYLSVLIICFLILLPGCITTGKKKTQYGAKIELPAHGNYTKPSQVPVVPLPGDIKPELTLEEMNKTFYVPYSDLFTITLKALRSLDLSLNTFNSTSGMIEFTNIQGQTYYLRLYPDDEFNSRSLIKIFTPDGSRRIDKVLINNIFNSISIGISKM